MLYSLDKHKRISITIALHYYHLRALSYLYLANSRHKHQTTNGQPVGVRLFATVTMKVNRGGSESSDVCRISRGRTRGYRCGIREAT